MCLAWIEKGSFGNFTIWLFDLFAPCPSLQIASTLWFQLIRFLIYVSQHPGKYFFFTIRSCFRSELTIRFQNLPAIRKPHCAVFARKRPDKYLFLQWTVVFEAISTNMKGSTNYLMSKFQVVKFASARLIDLINWTEMRLAMTIAGMCFLRPICLDQPNLNK